MDKRGLIDISKGITKIYRSGNKITVNKHREILSIIY